MDEQLKSNLTSSTHWLRFLYMLVFAFALYLASFVAAVLIVVQFVFTLVTAAPNTKLKNFGYSLVTYIQQCFMFLTYNSESKPFPFADWPQVPDEVAAQQAPTEPEPVASKEEPKDEDFHNAKTQVLEAVTEPKSTEESSSDSTEASDDAEVEAEKTEVASDVSSKEEPQKPAKEKSATASTKKKPASKKSTAKDETPADEEEEKEKDA